MNSEIENIAISALNDIKEAYNLDTLEIINVKYFGRKGIITKFLRSISSLPESERPHVGRRANDIRKIVKANLVSALERIKIKDNYDEILDISLPGRKIRRGHTHPITQTTYLICSIFSNMGFTIVEGSEVETDYYNFEALNLHKHHPARDMQDTFYVSDNILLRTHTSSTQPRFMEKNNPPVHIISPGKVYRCDSDITHTPMFHQVEGLFVDINVSFGDLKGVISSFIQKVFGYRTKLRFRPSFFPFTEPSAEVDIKCVICNGKGCRVCSNTGWIEVLGSGMVHPNVFDKVGYDTSRYTGFAFGMGVERIAMLKYRVDDIRKYFENDFRFLSQF